MTKLVDKQDAILRGQLLTAIKAYAAAGFDRKDWENNNGSVNEEVFSFDFSVERRDILIARQLIALAAKGGLVISANVLQYVTKKNASIMVDIIDSITGIDSKILDAEIKRTIKKGK